MRSFGRTARRAALGLMCAALFALTSCAPGPSGPAAQEPPAKDIRYLSAVEEEPDTVDFQCTSLYYTVAQNVFNRLVEMENGADGGIQILPSLAESWEVSEDGRRYVFHLRSGVRFSNGAPLTASDVEYTFHRLLTHPNACNQDIAECILGAEALEEGRAERLQGFELLGEGDFAITLEEPFEAFLACLSMPGASILDQETTEAAGERFGTDPVCTVGTGSFILSSWTPGEGMRFAANPDCWAGAPQCPGLALDFIDEAEAARRRFEAGELDILDLDELGDAAEYYMHGDIYRERLKQVQQIGIAYIALNESVQPLNDARVRRALQLALNRPVLLDVIYSGRGLVEQGIFPHGLYGYNPELPEIPYAPAEAARLLREAGLGDGFELAFTVRASSAQWVLELAKLAAGMWQKIGVRTKVTVLPEDEFMRLRKSGKLTCYAATWIADYNDPDNFIYTFFGSRSNTAFRSLCYPDEAVMERVRRARTIRDSAARLEEYRALEQKIIQEDAAWIPLFSRQRFYVTSNRLEGFRVSWNGSVKNNYRHMALK